MKILRIRLKNLNSLKGEHSVDLTAEPLASAGLFAITGPTGAGKSTLLDAVTLALYGRAARYGNESNPEHVMSRHCGECAAEVEFEVPSGTYRAVWERHRARKKADGALQQPKRYIYDASGEPLAQQIREAEQKIEELLGLNYDRFLRSALLAQGEFARFLKANANERAELLESLTGTEIYSRLGRRAFEEATRRENDLALKKAGLEQISILEEVARQALETAVQQGELDYKELGKKIESGAEMLGKISKLEDARCKELNAVTEQAQIGKDTEATALDLERLRRHQLTLPFTEDLARLDAAEKAFNSCTVEKGNAESAHEAAKKKLLEANFILCSAVGAGLEAQRQRAKTAGENVEKESATVASARNWLNEHKTDAVLADQLGDLVAAIGELKAKRTSLARDWSAWRDGACKILPADAKLLPATIEKMKDSELQVALDGFLGKAEKRRKTLEAEGKEAKKQLDLRKDHLGKAKLMAKIKDHRHDLKTGQPCPLCGALEHPYAEGAAPSPEIDELASEVDKASDKFDDIRETYQELSGALGNLKSTFENLIGSIRDCEKEMQALDVLLKPLSAEVPSHGDEDTLRSALKGRELAHRKQVKAESDATTRKTDAERSAKDADEEVKVLETKLGKLEPLPDHVQLEPVVLEDVPQVSEAEEAVTSAIRDEGIKAAQCRDRVESAKTAFDKLAKLKEPLEGSVAESEFKTIDNLLQARLATDAAKEIQRVESSLKQRTTAAGALLSQARQDITKLLDEKVLEGGAAQEFKTQRNQLTQDRDNLLAEQTTRKNQIKTDDENRQLRRQKERELGEESESLVGWKRLRELIGSQDGSKFRRYAQTISLDILTRHANRHLAKLSDRYLICRDEAEALNLQIEDRHQASVRRPMASLSGGESFLVSLALALGLSDLAGRTVRIDSLFIDEGFGSLDPETLEIAIASLESLRQDHKTVGIISHVGLLKERISTQIVVEKHAGGVSRIRVVPEEINR